MRDRNRSRVLLLLLALLALPARAAPQVEVFSPQGEARELRQVAVRFSEPMVALGDPRLPEPFEVNCAGDPARLKGRGRWADARNWVYDFAADLPAGQRCSFKLKPGLKSIAGELVAGRRDYAFNSGGPAVLRALPDEGEEMIDDEQWFLLAFDAPVDPASLAQGAWCEADGINERIPLKLLGEAETRQLLAANRQRSFSFYAVYFKGEDRIPLARFKIEDKRWKSLPVHGVRCARRLPSGGPAALVIGTGVRTLTGLARSTPQRLAFRVRPAFELKFTCQRVSKDADCLPVTAMRLAFNATVTRAVAAAIRLKPEQGWGSIEPKLEDNAKTVEYVEFPGPFPEKARYTIELPGGFADDAGRAPANKAAFPLRVATDVYPPLAKFPARFGILELNADPLLPVTVRGIEADLAGQRAEPATAGSIPGRSARLTNDETRIIERYRSFMRNAHDPAAAKRLGHEPREGELPALSAADRPSAFSLPRAGDGKPMEVIGIPFRKPGFYLLELASPRLGRVLHGEDKPYYVSTSVLVTNLAVHLKHGRERSIVWVTTLDGGRPVAGARVSVRDCSGRQYFEGTTDASGIADASDTLPRRPRIPGCRGPAALYAFAHLGEDMSFTSSDWDEGIAPWNFNVDSNLWRERPLSVHTVFDRTLLRPGETVSMKHIARVPVRQGFRFPTAAELPRSAELVHLGSGQKVALQVRFDAGGVAESVWKIPREAKLGSYGIRWLNQPGVSSNAEFRVEAFRVPLMRAVLSTPKEAQVRPRSTRVDAAVNYLAGGPAAGLAVKVRHRIEPRSVSFADYPGFRFGGQDVKEGVQSGGSDDYWSSFDPESESAPSGTGMTPVSTRTLALDAAGSTAITIDRLPPVARPASLLVEMEYADPNGAAHTAATRVALHPAAVYLGIKPEGWAANRDKVNAQVLAVDTAGRPLASRTVAVEVFLRTVSSYRRRLIGGFYAYESSTETRRLSSTCAGNTDARGMLFCKFSPGASGELMLVARAKDDAGNQAVASASVWVMGGGEWWFEPANHDRIDLVPEKRRYEPGETAKFQVRMPFREATVLVSVEREGVIDQKVVHLKGSAPVIEVPIAAHYGPNVFVSALAVRGRIAPEVPGPYAWLKRWIYRVAKILHLVDEVPRERDTRPTALVDLAKPAYKLGLASIQVGRGAYELKVQVVPDKTVLRARDTVRVAIHVSDPAGKPAGGGEVALAAVDEGLLELRNNDSWDILDGLLVARPEEVATSTAQGQVIGKRHFGRKALPPGGGGGSGGARELFDTLLLWKARVPLDSEGNATVDIPMNDSLTSFRLVAVAQHGAAQFGHGSASVRTTQDLMLFSGLPPVVRVGDEFSAMFTLRNTTAQPLATEFAWDMRDRPASGGKVLASGKQAVNLAPGQSQLLSLPVRVPAGVTQLYWEVGAAGRQDGAAAAQDRLRVTQTVREVHPVRVLQATLAQLDQPLQMPLERPADALPGQGGVRVEIIKSLAGELTPVYEYFERYAYTCFEQNVSKAVGLGSEARWAAVVASLPNYLDRDGLVRYFPSDRLEGSDTLTAYVVQIADAAGYAWPEEGLRQMLDGLEAFATGKIVRGSAIPTADLSLRKLAAIEALARHKRAKPAMLDSISIDPALWPTSGLIDWIGILQRVPTIARRDTLLAEALSQLRARLNFQGTNMSFSTERNDALWWLMVSADVNANRALLAVLDDPQWREDIGRMLRGTLSRQNRGVWGTTVANAWGVAAIGRFSAAFEKTPVSGSVSVDFGAQIAQITVLPRKQQRDFAWPDGRETLRIAQTGSGAPWAIVQARAALPLKAPLSTGYAIRRTVSMVEQKDKTGLSRGDVYRVSLAIDAQTDMTWVVVEDPIPAGAAILGSGLGGDSSLLSGGEKRAGWAWPAFIERTQNAYRAYYAFVPKGGFKLEYTVRLNNPGRFSLPSTRVEAMYSPELFGEIPNAAIEVRP